MISLGMIAVAIAYLASVGGVANGGYFAQSLFVTGGVFAVLAVSLDLVAGVTGLYSLGHAGLFALGAYGTTLLYHAGWNIFVLLPVVIVGVGLIGAILGTLSLRVSGLYFAIMTFIFSLVVTVVLTDFPFTGGLNGIAGPPLPSFPASLSFLGSSLVWCVGLVLLLAVGVVWSIRASAMYPVLLAIRDAEPFAAANGVRTAATKVGVFALSAGLAAMAGWAFSFTGYISPSQFTWTMSVNILVMVIFGGINTRVGPLIGAAFVSAFPVVVSIDPLVQEAIFGLIFLLVIVLFPGGVMGLVGWFWRRIVSRSSTTRHHVTDAAGEPAVTAPIERPARIREVSWPSDEYALECEGIRFSYIRGNTVVDDVDLRVRRGTVHGLIGPNGSGKSTLVNLISGALRPDAGEIRVSSVRVDGLPAHRRPGLGLLRTFQTAVLADELSVRESVTIGLYHRTPRVALRSLIWPLLPSARRDHRRIRSEAGEAIRSVGLAESWNEARVADVPHGVEQLTQLAAACVGEPNILILDEPLAGLSASEVAEVTEIIDDLRAKGVTMVIVEHQTQFIFGVCDDVTVLAAGKLVTSGPAEQVRQNERVREVYLGQ
ncbi:ATP-binding cassette domain-containing protein [Microbacterium sp. STN6]|uniref:branched-chain amino acid ABC transporter ATP-binding protein/permease n=1 Tax=Microbacterium sp. STN6 TaxID=2995588 RepID=UPI002260B55E|nr:ATP-binding cassette domain-containing protein [Microbacterium sp. STN6]MCX7521016.1 ATP-binding cassette domain-containing protein [Microbacterium sp. STN6]